MKSKEEIVSHITRKLSELLAPEIIQLIKRKTNLLKKRKTSELQIPRYTKTFLQLFGQEIHIPDIASFRFMYKEIFEQEIYKFKTSTRVPYIIDGGANIGLATIYLKRLFPTSKIVAFEPDSEIFKNLKHNIEAFNFDQIELIEKGLWNIDTSLFFKPEGADAGLIGEIDKNNTSLEKKIKVVSLKPYLQETVDFLKLDIEGSETIVLKDIQGDLCKVDRIFVEYHSFIKQPQTLNEIIDILTKAGFRLYMSIPGNNSLSSPLTGLGDDYNMDFQLNIFGFKEGKI